MANYIVEMASIIYRCALFLPVAEEHEEKRELYHYYMNKSATRIDYLIKEIRSLKDHYGESIEDLKADFVIK